MALTSFDVRLMQEFLNRERLTASFTTAPTAAWCKLNNTKGGRKKKHPETFQLLSHQPDQMYISMRRQRTRLSYRVISTNHLTRLQKRRLTV
ncbi:hypothetical protein BaRGS_00017357 [Batillaria attramentaria]|uniref:Uncharacterized protein n=1 Tax=Batillaria attramentaria TaxID=370345 RepID=A0ABD0KWV4_9CAEN